MQILGRLLVLGYGLAAIGGVLAHQAGLGLTTVILVFWLGGAAAVIALGLGAARFLPDRVSPVPTEEDALAEALRQWEDDRLTDRAAAEAARARRAGAF